MPILRLYFLAFIASLVSCGIITESITGYKMKTFKLAGNSELVFNAAGTESYYYKIVTNHKGNKDFAVALKDKHYTLSATDTIRVGPALIQDLKFYNKSSSSVQFTLHVELYKQKFEFPTHRIYVMD